MLGGRVEGTVLVPGARKAASGRCPGEALPPEPAQRQGGRRALTGEARRGEAPGPSLATRGRGSQHRLPAPRSRPALRSINADHLAPAIWWPDTGQASAGTFHVTFPPPRLSGTRGYCLWRGEMRSRPRGWEAVCWGPRFPGQGPPLRFPQSRRCEGQGGVCAVTGAAARRG